MDNAKDLKRAETAAIGAARSVGLLMRRHLAETKRAHSVTQHDIKLDLDVRSQKLIERTLHSAFPNISLLGEEGVAGKQDSDFRWVVDPIDGTVNFAYGIPHACVSIALQGKEIRKSGSNYEDGYQTLVGVVYDPFCDEIWTAITGQPARLNGSVIRVSQRTKVSESIVAIGFAKTLPGCFLPGISGITGRLRPSLGYGRAVGNGRLQYKGRCTGGSVRSERPIELQVWTR